MESSSRMTPQYHPFTAKTPGNDQEMADVAVNPLQIELAEHTTPFSGEIVVLSTPSFPELLCSERPNALQNVDAPPAGWPPIGAFIDLRYPGNKSTYFGVRIVYYNSGKKLYNTLHTICDGPCIEVVDLTDLDFYNAYDPRAFIRSSRPNASEAYVESVVSA